MPSAQGRPFHGSARQPSGLSGQSGKESGLLSLLDVQASRRRRTPASPTPTTVTPRRVEIDRYTANERGVFSGEGRRSAIRGAYFCKRPKRGVCRECAKRQIRQGLAVSCTRPWRRPRSARPTLTGASSQFPAPGARSERRQATPPPPGGHPDLTRSIRSTSPPRSPRLRVEATPSHPTRVRSPRPV